MKDTGFRWVLSGMLLLGIFLNGCTHVAGDKKEDLIIVATSEAFNRFSGEYENTAYFRNHKPETIAVLPFKALKEKSYSISYESENPGEIVRRGMYNHIASLPFRDLELYETDKRLKNAGLTTYQEIDDIIAEHPEKLRSILGVDAVFTGEVTHFDRIFAGVYSQLAVGCEVKFWDLKTGNLLWRAKHVQRSHAGGVSLNPVGLIMSSLASLWNLRTEEMLSQTDDLFREVISTIDVPTSEKFGAVAAPKIDMFAAINADKPFTLGKQVHFRLLGDPGNKAYVDLGDFKSGIELHPVSGMEKQQIRAEMLDALKANYQSTGKTLTPELLAAVEAQMDSREIYTGNYTVNPNEEIYNVMASAYLVSPAGGQARLLDTAHPLDIDSLPPGQTQGVRSASLDGKVNITWTANTEADLSGYEIWTSPQPLSGYAQAAETEKNGAVLDGRKNFDRFYVRVRALDRAANAGPFSKPAEAVALPVPGLFDLPQPGPSLGGTISEPVLLVAEKNPYTVNADLIVTTGGTLYLAPGVRVMFAPATALKISGGALMAYGRADTPVTLTPSTANAEAGAWQGLVLQDATRARLEYVTIEKAATGITIGNSAPALIGATVRDSAQAGLHLMDNARPDISCSMFSGNQGQGAMVFEGEGLQPIIKNSVFEENSPFQVQSYAPIRIDLSGNYWGQAHPSADSFLGDIQLEPMLDRKPDHCTGSP